MTWKLDASQQEVLDAADKIVRRELAPLAPRMDAEEWWPETAMPRVGAAGMLGLTVPAELGGTPST